MRPETQRRVDINSLTVAAGTDLLTAWLVDVAYDRIGARSRRIHYVLYDEDVARKLVRCSLCRPATVRKRGV